jgi:hypothetical protein
MSSENGDTALAGGVDEIPMQQASESVTRSSVASALTRADVHDICVVAMRLLVVAETLQLELDDGPEVTA